MNNYSKEQLSPADRRFYGIKTYRISSVVDDGFLYDKEPGYEVKFPLLPDELKKYKAGDYVDIRVENTGNSGFRARLFGKTPPEFIPGYEKESACKDSQAEISKKKKNGEKKHD